MSDPEQTYEKPKEYTPKNVIYWEETSRKLRQDKKTKITVTKANKFIQAGCVKRLNETTWVCEALTNYNKTTHFIRSIKDQLVCSCQGFSKKHLDYDNGNSNIKPFCSHTVAVKQFCFLEAKNEI